MEPATRRTRLGMALLAATAVVITGSYFAEYAQLPFLYAPILDSGVYLAQAQAIADGRFGDPTLLAYSPLYGYFLCLLGGGTVVPVAVQLCLGLCNIALVVRIVGRRFGPAAAVAGGALFLGYGLFLFYESKIQSETLGLTLTLLGYSMYLSPRFAGGRLAWALGCGVVVGLAVLARASLVFAAPLFVMAAFLPWSRGEPARPRLRRTAAIALGVLAPLLANGLWNRAHTGFFVPVIFASQVLAKTTATTGYSDDFRSYAPEGKRSANAWDVVHQAEERLRRGPDADAASPVSQINIVGFLEQAPAKLWRTFWDLEMTSFEYLYYGERDELGTLKVLPVSFGILLLLACVGAVFLVRREGVWALCAHVPLVAGVVATTTLFYPSSRYRAPMVLTFIVLGAYGVIALARAARPSGAWLARGVAGVVALACALLAARTITYQRANPFVWEVRVAQSAQKRGDLDEVLRRQRRACAQDATDADLNFHDLFHLKRCSELEP